MCAQCLGERKDHLFGKLGTLEHILDEKKRNAEITALENGESCKILNPMAHALAES